MAIIKLNSVIGGIFGLLFVMLNTGQLNPDAAWTVRAAGVLAFIGLVALVRRHDGQEADGRQPAGTEPFRSRGYRVVVAAEVVAFVVGIVVLRGPLDASDAVIGWVSLVVGLHFLGLAHVWHAPFFNLLGAAIAWCGAAGLIAAGAHASVAVIAVIAGVLPGAILLVSAYFGALGRTTL